jgi:hypothetical protein
MKNLLLILLIVGSRTARANSQVAVVASCQSPGFSYFQYSFYVGYKNDAISKDAHIEIVSGYSGHGSIDQLPANDAIHWYQRGLHELPNLQMFYLATGGYLDQLDFIFKITNADGNVSFDDGTANTGTGEHFYSATFFKPESLECFDLGHAQNLTIERK